MKIVEGLGNVLWIVLGGWLLFLEYCLGGLLLCITIIGIPFGIEAFKLAAFALIPFGSDVEDRDTDVLRIVFNVIWVLLFGWGIFLTHLACAGLFAITIIGLPFAWQHIKFAWVALWPFGKRIVWYTGTH